MNKTEALLTSIIARIKCSGRSCDECKSFWNFDYDCLISACEDAEIQAFADKLLDMFNNKYSFADITEDELANIVMGAM